MLVVAETALEETLLQFAVNLLAGLNELLLLSGNDLRNWGH